MPAPGLDVGNRPIHHWELIRRSGGKAHLVEEVVRLGGTVVYFKGLRTMSAEEFETYSK